MPNTIRSWARLGRHAAVAIALLASMLVLTPARSSAEWPYYQLQAAHSGLCVEMAWASSPGDYRAYHMACDPTRNQFFELQPTGDGTYRIRHSWGGYCLAVEGGSLNRKAQIVAEGCSTDWRQQWWINGNGYPDGYREFANRRSELCMDVEGDKTGPALIWQYTCDQGLNQQFRRIHLDGSPVDS